MCKSSCTVVTCPWENSMSCMIKCCILCSTCSLLHGNPNLKAPISSHRGGHEVARVGRPLTDYTIVI